MCTCGLHKGRTVIESHHWRTLLLLFFADLSSLFSLPSGQEYLCDFCLLYAWIMWLPPTNRQPCLSLNPVLDKERTQKRKCNTRKSEGQGSVCLSKYVTYKGLVLWSVKFCAVLETDLCVILKSCDSLYEPALFLSFWKQSDHIFHVCLTMGVSMFVPFSSRV